MTKIPSNETTLADLMVWDEMKKQLAILKKTEALLRAKIFKSFFPNPVEGMNKVPLENDWVLKGEYTITRKLDIGVIPAIKDPLIALGVAKPDALIKYEPSLVLSKYRELTKEQMHVFDQALIITPGSPTLEIVLPASAKKIKS